jgi:propanol-preferring alcohol dehydrogenase
MGMRAMRAMVLERAGAPLAPVDWAIPSPAAGQVLVRVEACGVCRTDLHVLDGDLTAWTPPLVLGHEIVGTIAARGPRANRWTVGTRVGIPWLGGTCGQCGFCRTARENLCAGARFTGYHLPGGYAEYTIADEGFCLALPADAEAAATAPLLCAGLIGHRALRRAGDAARLGIYGFGAAAHIVTQVARAEGRRVFAFTRRGDEAAQALALDLGAVWAGDSESDAPQTLDAALIFAPVGPLVPRALAAVERGGVVVCAGIHMSAIPSFPYELLWGERSVCSIANLTRQDGEDFLAVARRLDVRTTVEVFPLGEANTALTRLREGRIRGAAVLAIAEPE